MSSTPKLFSTVLASLVAAVLALLALKRAKEKRLVRLAPKGNLGYWLIGDMLGEYMVSPQRYIARKVAEYGSKNFTRHMMLEPLIMIGDLEDRDNLLALEHKGKVVTQWPNHIRELLGRGTLLLLNGGEHARLRRLLTPHLTQQALASYVDLLDGVILKWLDNAAAKHDFISATELKSLTMDVFLQTVFGGNATHEELLSLERDLTLFMGGFLSLVPFPLGEFNCYGKAMGARKRLVETMSTIVARFKARGEEGKGKGKLLEALIKAEDEGKGFSHEELMNNLILVGLGGLDTTAAAMSTTIALLYTPEGEKHLTKLREEVKQNIKPGTLHADELKELPWMNAVLNELFRYKTPSSGGHRMALEDLPLKDGTIVPKGVNFMNYFVGSNFNEEYWGADATEFDPERFSRLKDDGTQLKYNLVGFGRGVHICPGEHLARLELRVFLVRIAQKYTFEVKDKREMGLPMNMIHSNFKGGTVYRAERINVAEVWHRDVNATQTGVTITNGSVMAAAYSIACASIIFCFLH